VVIWKLQPEAGEEWKKKMRPDEGVHDFPYLVNASYAWVVVNDVEIVVAGAV